MIASKQVHDTLRRYQLVDGFPFVVDLDGSHGVWLRDARTGKDYFDAFTCFASWPVGYNHPMLGEAAFETELLRAARTKLANSDLYTCEMAGFVEAFGGRVTPPGFPYHFWVSGGTLAVENALKTAFDWKARKLGRTNFEDDVNDLVVLHFEQAFHGRSGYTMSLTNTVPDKIGLFPKFDWPRVHSPAIEFDTEGGIANDIGAEEKRTCAEIEAAFARHPKKIAAIIIEPMQGEGGDNHFRTEFLQKLRDYADENEALLIYDEVQTGFFGSGKPWLWQHHGVAPDVVCFGKKTQVCGIYVSTRVDEVQDNVFARSSRINSTWGGNLVDMVRCRRFIEIVESEGLAANITERGNELIAGLRTFSRNGGISNVRGLGSLVAFTLKDTETRDRMLSALFDKELLALASGPVSIRFRLPMVLDVQEVQTILERVEASLPSAVGA
ncbi:MAG: L-lysine 6-transaminase [Planctomycetes bacterium]|jgi:L-lysine 6-transaminase|nr:L-lysine 6-transaminase [Planctomycetota bacterium]